MKYEPCHICSVFYVLDDKDNKHDTSLILVIWWMYSVVVINISLKSHAIF